MYYKNNNKEVIGMKYLFAVNPVSGKNKARKKMNRLAALLRKHKFNFMLYETKPYHYANDLRKVIIENNITHVFAVGGDGTAHEVLNSIIGLDVYYGVIPFGSGNDFARLLKLPKKRDKILRMLQNNDSIEIDVGKAGERYFVNYISFGFDVEILKKSYKIKKVIRSGIAYIFSLLSTLITYKCQNYNIDNKSEKIYLATIHNGKYYGGGMKINPFAEINDGLLDLCVVKKMSRLKLLTLFPSVFSGKHYKFKKIVSFKSRRNFTIENENKTISCGMDGELYELQSPIEVTIVPRCVKMIRFKHY